MAKRVAKGPLQSFHRNQQKSKVRCTLARLAVFSTRTSLAAGSSGDHGLHLRRGLARRQCRNRGLGMERIPANPVVPVERVWTETEVYRSEQEPYASTTAKERVGYCSQLHVFCSFLQGWPALFPGGIPGAGARAGGRGMAELGKPGNAETLPFPACWNNPLGWCELSSIGINCEQTVCLWSGERDSTNNNLWSFPNMTFRKCGLSF